MRKEKVRPLQVLNDVGIPWPCASQLHLLEHYEEFRSQSFRQKVRVNPEIFDSILDQISDHPIFHSESHNSQLPVAIQLTIFLNHAGHYGNGSTPDEICEWVGVSVGSVTNCSNRVMVAILDQHDEFVRVSAEHSEEMEETHQWVKEWSC